MKEPPKTPPDNCLNKKEPGNKSRYPRGYWSEKSKKLARTKETPEELSRSDFLRLFRLEKYEKKDQENI